MKKQKSSPQPGQEGNLSASEHAAPEENLAVKEAENQEVDNAVEGQSAPVTPSAGLLEALLLASGEALSFIRLQELMRCGKDEVLQHLQLLQTRYNSEECGLEVVQVGDRLQLRTKAVHSHVIRELLSVRPRKLSHAALETLSVIAYQQPIVKSEIDKIRGVDVAPTIRTLLDRNLVKIIGYQASAGQPVLYGTSDEFLKVFGLKRLDELPALRDLKTLAKEPGESGVDSEESENSAENSDVVSENTDQVTTSASESEVAVR